MPAILARSTGESTLVRCPVIALEAFEKAPIASLDTISALSLRAGELARFMIEQIDADEFVRRGPFLESR